MTESPAGHTGRHRLRTPRIGDRHQRAFTVLSALTTRASRNSLSFVRAALTHRPEPIDLRRGLAALGAAALLSLGFVGATPASGHPDSEHDTAAGSSSASETDEREEADPKFELPEPNKADKKEPPEPVAGLSRAQMNNAITIVRVGDEMNLSKRGQAVAIATAMQESKLKNLASHAVPESANYDNEGFGSDMDSVGLFQQRPSMGWGTVKQCMDAEYASETFYKRLKQVGGWQDMPIAQAAQAVQASAFPDAYAQWEDLAHTVVDEVHG